MMSLYKILLLSLLATFCSCTGKVHTNLPDEAVASKASPEVIRNYKAVEIYPDYDTTLVSQYVRSIFQDSKGNLWFGTLGEGVVRYDHATLQYFGKPEGLTANSIQAIAEDKQGNLWFGTDLGAFKYDGKNFRSYTGENGLNKSWVGRKCILSDSAGRLWIGTEGGVFQYNPAADSIGGKCFWSFNLLDSINVTDIIEDKSGNIWFASHSNGVFRYDGKTIINLTEKEGLGDNYAGGIIQDRAGNFWFTMKEGICRYDGKSFTSVTAKDGLGGSEIWGIYIEKSGIIWITARGSTTRFDPSAGISNPQAFTVFTPKDGINCCVQSMYQDKDGNMWWGAGQGLYRFDGKRFYQVKQKGPW